MYEIKGKRTRIGLDMRKKEMEKGVKLIRNVEITEEESEFLELGENFNDK